MVRIDQLQGIRALAIVGVFLCHTKVFLGTEVLASIPALDLAMEKLGPTGVYTFLMLSGFLLGYKGRHVEAKPFKSAVRSAWQKIRKLYGLHLVMLVLAFIALFPQTTKEWVLAAVFLPFNLTLTQAWGPLSGCVNSFNGPSWFLSVFWTIWLFLFLWPGFVNRLQDSPLKKILATGALLLGIQTLYKVLLVVIPFERIPHSPAFFVWLDYFNPFLCYSEFLVGCVAGVLARRVAFKRSVRSLFQVASLLLAGVCLFGISARNVLYLPAIELSIALGLVGVLSRETPGARILQARPLDFLGNISASFFLIHGTVNYLLDRFFPAEEWAPWLFVGAFLISFGFSILADRLVQRSSRQMSMLKTRPTE